MKKIVRRLRYQLVYHKIASIMVQTCLSYKYKFENQENSWYIDLLPCTFTRKITSSAYEKRPILTKKHQSKRNCSFQANITRTQDWIRKNKQKRTHHVDFDPSALA